MTERDYILDRMTGPELQLFAEIGGTLSPKLQARLDRYRAHQRAKVAHEAPDHATPSAPASPTLHPSFRQQYGRVA